MQLISVPQTCIARHAGPLPACVDQRRQGPRHFTQPGRFRSGNAAVRIECRSDSWTEKRSTIVHVPLRLARTAADWYGQQSLALPAPEELESYRRRWPGAATAARIPFATPPKAADIHMSVAAGLLSGYLAAGAVVDNGCCADGDCGGDGCSTGICGPLTGSCQTAPIANDTPCTPNGPVHLCRGPATCQEVICTPGIGLECASMYGGCERLDGCNPATGQCDYGPAPDGARCNRGTGCAQGFCASGVCMDPPPMICTSNACRTCGYDPCNDSCTCFYIAGAGDPDCQRSSCHPGIGCVYESINEGRPARA